MEIEIIEAANHVAVINVVRRYLAPEQESHVCTIEGACVTTRRSWNRYGTPADSSCWHHVFEHPEQGWSFTVRSVWRDGRLHEPVAVHTTITDYYVDDTGLIADTAQAKLAVNDWLKAL